MNLCFYISIKQLFGLNILFISGGDFQVLFLSYLSPLRYNEALTFTYPYNREKLRITFNAT